MKKSEWFWDWVAKRYDKQAQKDEAHTRVVQRFAKYLNKPGAYVFIGPCAWSGLCTFSH